MPRLEAEVEIEALGVHGDGIATAGDARLFVPYTVPGDLVRVRLGERRGDSFAARLLRVLREGPGRAAPPCRHFADCGGCALQHWDERHYGAWKRSLVEAALARHGLGADELEPLVATPPRSRRRADLTAVRRRDDLVLGFNARASHRIVALAECHVLLPEITALFAPLRDLLGPLLEPGERAEILVNRADTGLDVLVVTGAALGRAGRERLGAFAQARDLARLSLGRPGSARPEIIVARRPVEVRFGAVPVRLPPAAFLQASREGETALVGKVREFVAASERVADLFAGCGTFALPLAAGGGRVVAVHAVDGDRDAIAALGEAAKRFGLAGVSVAVRDLKRDPLKARELGRFEAVVLDPPTAGAREQADELARSPVPLVAAVSCNPATFARDARILVDGGYRLGRIVPVDQFLWSPRVELVAELRRP